MSRVSEAESVNGSSLPPKTHKLKIPASPPLQEQRRRVPRRQRDQLFHERQHHLYKPLHNSLSNISSQAFCGQKLNVIHNL